MPSPPPTTTMSDIDYWKTRAASVLTGRTIVDVGYMTEIEANALGWHYRALVLTLDDGSQLIPQADDEGNEAGAMTWANAEKYQLLPVL